MDRSYWVFLYGVCAGAAIVSALGLGCRFFETSPAAAQYWPTPPTLQQQQALQQQQQTNQLYEQFLRQQLQQGLHHEPC